MRWLDGIHWLDGHEFEQAPGFGDGQGSLGAAVLGDHKKSDTTEWLNSTVGTPDLSTTGIGKLYS